MVTPPSAPNIEFTETKDRIKATVSGVGGIAMVSRVIFKFVKNTDRYNYDDTDVVGTTISNIVFGQAVGYFLNPEPGSTYMAMAAKYADDNEAGEYSSLSNELVSGPGRIRSITASAYSNEQIRLSYTEANGATKYTVEYCDNQEYFDNNPSEVQKQTDLQTTTPIIGGLSNEGGKTWYFRARGENDSPGPWSDIVSCLLATKPGAPTTWTYTVTAKIGEPITFNWTHNSADASEQTAASLEIRRNGAAYQTKSFTTESTYEFPTSGLTDQDVITWRVQTKGAHVSYGDWSEYKEVKLYAPPGIEVTGGLPAEVTSFPIVLNCNATPATQSLISYAVSITANNNYDTLDETGMLTSVPAGGTVYEAFVDSVESNNFTINITPGDVSLENVESYTIEIRIYMNSGLDGSITGVFETNFDEDPLYPDCTYTFDFDNLACYIEPTCYEVDDEDEDAEPVYTENVIYDIYRRNYDGSFTAIVKNMDGAAVGTIMDPHPSLDNARYRIVATSKATGLMVYDDVNLIEVGYKSIVIQWDEQWTNYSDNNFADVDAIPRTGSRLDLPYNVDISVTSSPDVALVEYIGRENPVSYYGTQKGESGNWKVDIPADDVDTLYAIRRLSRYSGDCYVREPSGIGYWAHVKVSYQKTHGKTTIPISMEVTKVEGGM